MLSGRIVNQSGLKLHNARILYGSWAYRLKDIEPNAARVFDEDTVPIGVKTLLTGLGLGRPSGTPPESDQSKFSTAEGSVDELLNVMMFYEAAGGSGFAGLPFRYQAHIDLSRQLTLGRAVLVAEVDGPASRLHLGESLNPAGANSRIDSRTIFRFVLPVSVPKNNTPRSTPNFQSFSMIETRDLTKKYGELFAIKSIDLNLVRGDLFGFIGPERFRQDDDDADPGDAAAADVGRGVRRRPFDLHEAERNSPPDRLHARFLRRVRRHEGHRVPRVLRGRVSHSRTKAAADLRRGARAGRARLQARSAGHELVSRHDAAAGPRPRVVTRSASAVARRAGERPRSAPASKCGRCSSGCARWARRS